MLIKYYTNKQERRSVVKSGGGGGGEGLLEGNVKTRGQRVAAGVWGALYALRRGPERNPSSQAASMFLTQTSSNDRRKRVKRRTIGGPSFSHHVLEV